MPLVVISGIPSSGKTTRATRLRDYIVGRGKTVHLISENESVPNCGFEKNEVYDDSQKEKIVRSSLKSEVLRSLNKDDVVILDALNYIKGYRYELYCASKAARTTQCTIFCGIQNDRAWEFNQQRRGVDLKNIELDPTTFNNSEVPYTREIFDALCMRYEEPHSNCRWDCPLIVVFPEDKLDEVSIYSALFESKPLPPNQSTQNPPLSGTNYLFELDRLTQKIVGDILAARKIGIMGPVPINGSMTKVEIPSNLNAIQLNRFRRIFLNYSKTQHATTSSLDKIPQLFVQFLNSNCNEI